MSESEPAANSPKENLPTPPEPAPAPTPTPTRKKRSRFPRWLKIVAALVILLALLALFAPTIASTGPVRSYVLGKVNANLNGRVEVGDWSLGWVSGATLRDVRVLDPAGKDVIRIASLTSDLSVLDVIRSNYSLGEAVIDGLEFHVRREADGELNLSKIAKSDPQLAPEEPARPEPSAEAPAAAAAEEPTKLPDLSGRIVVRNGKGTYEDVVKKQTVQFTTLDCNFNIPDINAPIENTLNLVASVDGGKQGTLKVSGSADVIEINEVRVESANVDESIELSGLDTSALGAMLPPGGIERLTGLTNASVVVKMKAGQSGQIEAKLTTANFAASGPALSGDTFTAREVSVVVPPTTIDMSSGHGAWQNWPIRIGSHEIPDAITLKLKHDGYEDTVALAAAGVTLASLQNLADNKKPGVAAGLIALKGDFNVGGLARQLPNVLAERDGKRLTSGRLTQVVRVALSPDNAGVEEQLDVTDLAVTRVSDGAVEKYQPVKQTLRFETLGGGWSMPDLRDIDLSLASNFAEGRFTGKELAQLKGNLKGDLAQAQRELGSFLPLGDILLAGKFDVGLTSSGDVTKEAAPLDLSLVATFVGLQINGISGLDGLRQGFTRLEAGAKVVRGKGGIESLDGVRVVARTGRSERELTLDSQLTADVKYVQTQQTNAGTGANELVRVAQVPRYTIERFTVDLPAARRDFPAQFAGLAEQGLRLDSGKIALTGSGNYSGDAVAFDVKGGLSNLNLSRGASNAAPVLSGFALNLDAAGTHAPTGTRVTRLDVADNQKMLTVRKGEGDLMMPAGENAKPAGEVVLGADVKRLLDLARAFSDEPAAPPSPDEPQLTSARLDGKLRLTEKPQEKNVIALSGNVDLTNISVTTPGEPIKNEKLALTLAVRSDPEFKLLNVDHVTVNGRLVNGRIHDTIVDLAAGDAPNAPPLAVIRKANAVLDFPRLGDLHALYLAINPPDPEEKSAETAEAVKPAVKTPAPARGSDVIGRAAPRVPEPAPAKSAVADASKSAPPGRILGGSANVRMTVGHESGAAVIRPVIAAKGVVVGADDVSKNVGDVDLTTAVFLVPKASAPTSPDATFMQRLAELGVSTFTLKGAGADVRLERPLTIKDPGGAAAADAIFSGRIKLRELLSALEAWNGAPPGTMYPYTGDATLRQQVATAAGAGGMTFVGNLSINEFATLGEGGKPGFAERLVTLKNNVNFDQASQVLRINDLSFAMESTKAVSLAAKGAIHELSTNRRLENVVVDLTYDAKPLWDILRPLMDPETGGKSLEEWQMAGKFTRRVELAGTYPADDSHPIRFVQAKGGFALEKLTGRGIDTSPDLSFMLDKGILRLAHAREAPKPAPAPEPESGNATNAVPEEPIVRGDPFNGGLISFEGAEIDLTSDHPRLTLPDRHPLVRTASLNSIFADTVLGRFVNPAFDDATQAKGILDVTVVSCRGLALDSAMQSPRVSDSGRVELRWSLDDLFLSQPELVSLIAKIKPNALNENGFKGSIRDGRVVIEGGQVQSDMTFNIDKYALKFNGGIGLAENKLVNFFAILPPELFAAIDRNFAKHVPREGYRVQLSGTTDNWLQNASGSILPIVADLGIRAGVGSALERALGGRDKDKDRRERDVAPNGDAVGERPAPEPSGDPLTDLLDRAIGGDKDRETDEEKRIRREKVRREREEKAKLEAERAATEPAPAPAEKKLSKKEQERERERQRQEEKRKEREERERKKKEQRQ